MQKMMPKNITTYFPKLEKLSADNKKILTNGIRIISAPAGTVMFSQGSECKGYVMLIEGVVRVHKTAEDGREIVLYRVEAGEPCIMTTSCLMGKDYYPAEGVAETDITLALVPPPIFNQLLAQSEIFRTFVFGIYAKRMAMLMMLVEDVVFQKLDKRLAQILLEKKTDQLDITHLDIALELGSVREVVSRQLKQFERQNFIRLGRGMIEICDRAGLEQITK